MLLKFQLSSKPIEVWRVGAIYVASEEGAEQSPQQLRGLHGNLATDHLPGKCENVLAKQTSVKQKAHACMCPWNNNNNTLFRQGKIEVHSVIFIQALLK